MELQAILDVIKVYGINVVIIGWALFRIDRLLQRYDSLDEKIILISTEIQEIKDSQKNSEKVLDEVYFNLRLLNEVIKKNGNGGGF